MSETPDLQSIRDDLRNQAQIGFLDRKDLLAKLENLDRTLNEFHLELQLAEEARKKEWSLVEALLSEERQDRRQGAQEAKDAQHAKQALIVSGVKAIWEKGGQWIIAAICLWIVLQMQKCSGASLLDWTKVLGG
jgi:hypothetical protein